MMWRRLIPILNLFFILVELSDPSTAFIRVSADSSRRPCLVVIKKKLATTDLNNEKMAVLKVDPAGQSDEKKAANSDSGFGMSDSHSALVFSFIVIEGEPLRIAVNIKNTGLFTQFEPPTLKRPPIMLT